MIKTLICAAVAIALFGLSVKFVISLMQFDEDEDEDEEDMSEEDL